MRISVSIAALAMLAGCAGIDSSAPDSAPATSNLPEPAATPPDNLTIMLEQARADRLAGRLPEAEAKLEAALRIQPNDARLWLELAEIQFAAGEFAAARNLAERAVTLAAGDESITEAAGRIRAQTTD
jgi:Flp pilus assembly protein TadD